MTALASGRPWNWPRLSTSGGLAVVIASIVLSIAAAGPLGATTRIRWGVGYHVGPEQVATGPVLVAFPVTVAAIYAGARLLGSRLETTEPFEDLRPVYEACVLGTLALVVVVQAALVLANVLS